MKTKIETILLVKNAQLNENIDYIIILDKLCYIYF